MTIKSDQHKIKLTGPGLSFDRPVSKEVATRITNLVMTGDAGAPATGSDNQVEGQEPAGGTTPKQFIAKKRPSNDYQRVACLAYYSAHHRNLQQFKTIDITKLATEAAMHLSNSSRAVDHATSTYHFLAKAGGGKKQITTLGELVVDALPDQDKVKAAIAEHKPRKRKRRQSKK
jgi:hypothetical protein